MSLDYDLTRIANRAENFPPDEDGKMSDTLHVLIWNTLSIGLGEITERNVDEVWYRTDAWQRLVGSGWNMIDSEGNSSEFRLTREDIVNAVGLHTNVSPMTRAAFRKRLMEVFENMHHA